MPDRKAPPILIVGGNSTIGTAVAAHLRQGGQSVLTTSRSAGAADLFLDLATPPDPALVASWPPLRAAVLCASVTTEAACRDNPDRARRVNVDHTIALARQLRLPGTFVLFLSSNLVFDGIIADTAPNTPCHPQTIYGAHKAAAEAGLLPLGAAILRLSKVLGPSHPLFAGWRRALDAGQTINAADNLRLAPVAITQAVAAIAALLDSQSPGIHQLSGDRDLSYAQAATILADRCGVSRGRIQPAALPLAAAAPHHTTMALDPGLRDLGFVRPSWVTVLDAVEDFTTSVIAAPAVPQTASGGVN
ncbi:MAG: sugar nucleotide-binding protein [Azospirillaceae bacterium]|nr:sugar nucleotide-binding protein [Azospirillaceae bacterium]